MILDYNSTSLADFGNSLASWLVRKKNHAFVPGELIWTMHPTKCWSLDFVDGYRIPPLTTMLVVGSETLHGRGIHPFADEIPTVGVWVISIPAIVLDKIVWIPYMNVDVIKTIDQVVKGYNFYYHGYFERTT